jgi:hypothetical protein
MKPWQIVAWSAAGGLVQGVIYGLMAVGLLTLLAAAAGVLDRVGSPWIVVAAIVAAPVIAGALLGAVEGWRKL